jgi:hypothetical protein
MIEKIKLWAKGKLLPWLKTNWVSLLNIIVLFYVYGKVDEAVYPGVNLFVGLWIFILAGYYGWKLFNKK